MRQYNYYLKIADVCIRIQIPYKMNIYNESINFICDKHKEDIFIKFIEIKNQLSIEGEFINTEIINVYQVKNKFIHEFYSAPGEKPYGWLIPITESYYEVRYIKGFEKYITYSGNVMQAINIEQLLNKKSAFILHSSFIKWNNKGILFSAPSGTGKSTQANLWEKYEDAEIINGDKAGVRKIDDKWMAYGLPFAGSSAIFKNKKAEIDCIIVLKQGKENKLTKLSPREAFIKIYKETTLHLWDEDFQNNIINMISDLVQNIPVYQYECLPDKSAVDFLKQQIMKDDSIEKIYKD